MKCEMRYDNPVVAELSGGFNSYAVVYMANHLIITCEAPACELRLISTVNDPSQKSNELKFIICVEDHTEHSGIHLNVSKAPLFIHLSVENSNKIFNPLLFGAGYNLSLRREIKKQNGNILLFEQSRAEINYTLFDQTADLCDLFVKLKLLQLHYRVNVWNASQENAYPKVLWQNVIAPVLPLFEHRRDSMVPAIKVPEELQTSFRQKTSLRIDKLLADPVFARNSTYRQIADRSNFERKRGNNNDSADLCIFRNR